MPSSSPIAVIDSGAASASARSAGGPAAAIAPTRSTAISSSIAVQIEAVVLVPS
jgi:hypothetical protein